MPLQNRVTPLGDLVADPARGLVYGNRGCLHDASGRIRRRYAGKRWIACRLEFRGWLRSPLLQPGRFTELFFLDEVTAMAAGTGRVPSAAVRTTTGWASSGASSIPARPEPTRSTSSSTASARGAGRPSSSTTFPTARSCFAATSRGSCTARA